MATDLETLVVQMSADFKSYENAFAKASGITKQQLAGIKADATAAGGAAVVAFDQGARSAAKFGNQARAVGGNVRMLQAQTGNLAAQFQDIGVQLAGGQSPFQIALQQGTQISAVLGGQGAGGAVKALGAAFASVVSPVTLVTIGLIAAGGAAIQYFASLLGGSDESEDTLKKQADLIKQVAKEWEGATPALAAYVAEQEREQSLADRSEAVAAVQSRTLAEQQEAFRGLAEAHRVAISLIPDANREFGILAGTVESTGASAEDFQTVLDILNGVLANNTSPAISAVVAALAAMQAQAASTTTAMANLAAQASITQGRINQVFTGGGSMAPVQKLIEGTKEWSAEQARLNSLTAEQLDLELDTARIKKEAAGDEVFLTEEAAKRLAIQRNTADATRKAASSAAKGGGRAASKAATEADREREAVTKLIEQLRFEQSLIGLTAVEKEKLNALRRAGAAATPDEVAEIKRLVEESYNEVEAIKAVEDRMNELRAVSSDVLHGMFEDMRDGVKGAELLANALNRVAESFVSSGIDALIQGAFPTPGAAPAATGTGGIFGGRIIPGWLHQGGVAGAGGYSARAISPAVFQGAQRYHNGGVAGLMPGEVPAILQRGERVIPKGGGAGGVVLNYAPVIDARGADVAAVSRLEVALRQQSAQFRDRTIAAVADPRYRGGR